MTARSAPLFLFEALTEAGRFSKMYDLEDSFCDYLLDNAVTGN